VLSAVTPPPESPAEVFSVDEPVLEQPLLVQQVKQPSDVPQPMDVVPPEPEPETLKPEDATGSTQNCQATRRSVRCRGRSGRSTRQPVAVIPTTATVTANATPFSNGRGRKKKKDKRYLGITSSIGAQEFLITITSYLVEITDPDGTKELVPIEQAPLDIQEVCMSTNSNSQVNLFNYTGIPLGAICAKEPRNERCKLNNRSSSPSQLLVLISASIADFLLFSPSPLFIKSLSTLPSFFFKAIFKCYHLNGPSYSY
jgi:hypothetical protein